MMIIGTLICLIILTSQCVCVHSKVIIVNSNNGNDNTECCVNGECACSSLSTALLNIDNNTIINITSQSVALNNTTTMGSGKLTNITITGSNVTIMCNNSGSVYCESCDDVMIEGITWDRCSDPNGTNIAGVAFNGTSNISLVNCTFQYSRLPAVVLLEVFNIIQIETCKFLSNMPMEKTHHLGILSITRSSFAFSNNSSIAVTINGSYFYNNQYPTKSPGVPLNINIHDNSIVNCSILFENTTFILNKNAMFLKVRVFELINIQLKEILLHNNSYLTGYTGAGIGLHIFSNSNVALSILSSVFNGNDGSNLWCVVGGNKVSVVINNSNFTDSNPAVGANVPTVGIFPQNTNALEIIFYKVQLINNLIGVPKSESNVDVTTVTFSGAVSIVTFSVVTNITMYMVNFMSNQILGIDGGALYILLLSEHRNHQSIIVQQCQFVRNRSPGHGAALYVSTKSLTFFDNVQIANTKFDQNMAGSSVVYIQGLIVFIRLQLNTSIFTNNVASSIYLSSCNAELAGKILFKNNTAENGGAIYLTQGASVAFVDNTTVWLIANVATLNGGAIYVDLICSDIYGYSSIINPFKYGIIIVNSSAIFINNSARIAGNSLYFSVPRFCSVNTNISDIGSILYVPCQFNYSQPVNGKMTNIPCELDYTLLNGTGAPIVTSPHELRLYFPFNDGHNISSTSDYNVYFIRNNILGHPVKFTGAVFDYFGKPTEPVLFNMQLQCLHATKCSAFTLMGNDHDHILTQSIDNFTILNVTFRGREIDATQINVTLSLTSLSYSLSKIAATLVIELVPCIDHPGYTYSEESQTCVCYHHNVKCSDDDNEIKRGYWFGSIDNRATTSLCPNHYCKFTDRKQATGGYFELPNTINAQCNDHRVGRACGECSSGYTLSYDSTDCISVDQCGTGWTVLVITLTCLYWIVVVAGVFSLMYLKRHISLGYLYGTIYYYSMVGILLNNNPYVSDGAFQFVSVLSSFAQLTPQFLGEFCFVKGLSGIDQLFIHYSHAVGISLLLLLIVIAARCSARISLFVSRCIIRVICLLILLSYTSIASTSLQLLRPLRFTDVKEWYTYSSPSIQYFHERHIIYVVVAVICELVIGVGLPLLLLLEPVLSRKINFIRIKPLLDQFQGCYKDKYRWFAAYYLICRQVIFLIACSLNINYYNMLFYLQTICVGIAVIHIWIQPYHSDFLNALDGVMLLLIVLEVNINTFSFFKNVTTEIALVPVILPLILFSTFALKNLFSFCLKRWYYSYHNLIKDSEREPTVRYVALYCVCMHVCMYVQYVHTYVCMYLYVCMYVYVCMYYTCSFVQYSSI